MTYMRKKIIAGNWKMNNTVEEAFELITSIEELLEDYDLSPNTVVIIAPPFIHLKMLNDVLEDSKSIKVSAQNCHHEKSGAYTGEVSATMIKSTGTQYVIIGHSERRMYFLEDNNLLKLKVISSIRNDLTPIYCCGEILNEREENRHFEVVNKQLSEGLFHLDEDDIVNTVIAYEPVWAIGTGKTASPAQAQEMHAFIREQIEVKYGKHVSDIVPILYGGSCNPGNAKELFSQTDVDGGLIGGASLKAADFVNIIKSV